MLKSRGQTGDGRPLVVLGLSGENLTRLAADEPIQFDLAELGLPSCVVVVMYGRTETALAARLQEIFGGRPPNGEGQGDGAAVR